MSKKEPAPHTPTHMFFVLAEDPAKLDQKKPDEMARFKLHSELTNALKAAGATKIEEKAKHPKFTTTLGKAAEIPWGDPINPVFMLLTKAITDGLVDSVVDPLTNEIFDKRDYPLKKKPGAPGNK